MVARYNMATALAASTPAGNPALLAATAFDVDALADSVARPEGFGDATRAALAQVRADPRAVLTLALASPELSLC
jgi:hypothetical protein